MKATDRALKSLEEGMSPRADATPAMKVWHERLKAINLDTIAAIKGGHVSDEEIERVASVAYVIKHRGSSTFNEVHRLSVSLRAMYYADAATQIATVKGLINTSK